jgi:hypothetical protein
VGPVLHLTRSRPSVGRADTSCRDPETSQRQRLGAHEPCWPQDLLQIRSSWSRHDALALPLLPLHVPPPPSPCSSCPPAICRCCPCRSPQAPPPKVCMCRCPPPCSRRLVGWLSHEARLQQYSLALHREGGDGQRMQQALVMAPPRGVIHSGFVIEYRCQPPPSPLGLAV